MKYFNNKRFHRNIDLIQLKRIKFYNSRIWRIKLKMNEESLYLIRKLLHSQELTSDDVSNIQTVCSLVTPILKSEPAVLKLSGHFIIVGDIHGNFDALIDIFEKTGYPNSVSYIFLGDYVDRGPKSLEVCVFLFCLKVLFPAKIYLLRGNHDNPISQPSSNFTSEINSFSNQLIYNGFFGIGQIVSNCFVYLPLACILDTDFLVHGGISPSIKTYSDIFQIVKPIDFCKEGTTEFDLLWSDPKKITTDFAPNSIRGASYFYGQIAVNHFLTECNFSNIIRAHEYCINGYDRPLENVITLFSSYNYLHLGNNGAILDHKRDSGQLITITYQNRKKRRIIYPDFILQHNFQDELIDYSNNDSHNNIDDTLFSSIRSIIFGIFA